MPRDFYALEYQAGAGGVVTVQNADEPAGWKAWRAAMTRVSRAGSGYAVLRRNGEVAARYAEGSLYLATQEGGS